MQSKSWHMGFLPETRDMVYLNYLGLRVSTSATSLLSVSGSGCWYYAKCKTVKWCYAKWTTKWTCKIVDIPQHGEMEAVVTDTSWLTASVADSCCRFPKRSLKCHIADIKNIASNDQATLRVYQNSANVEQFFKIFVYEIANDAPWLTAVTVATKSNHHLPKIAGMIHCRCQKHRRLWPVVQPL